MTTTSEVTFEFYGDELAVRFDGRMWVSGGTQYGSLAEAVTAECREYLSACGDDADSGEFDGAIENAFAEANASR